MNAIATTIEESVETIRPTREARSVPQTRRQPPYHVVLWDDNDHSYDYVIRMMRDLFGHGRQTGLRIANDVDGQGRAVCLTTTMELAELKRDQILAYGKDSLVASSRGSMYASIEPAPSN